MLKNLFKMGAVASMMLAVNASAQTWVTDASNKSVRLNPSDGNVVVGASPSSWTTQSRLFVKYGSNQSGLTVVNSQGVTKLQLTKDGGLLVGDVKTKHSDGLTVGGVTELEGSLYVDGSATFHGTFSSNGRSSFYGGLESTGLSIGATNKQYKDFVTFGGSNGSMNMKVSGYGGLKPFTFEASEFTFKGNLKCQGNVDLISLNSQAINVENLAAKDITMEMKNAADYVFDANYDLKSLSEVESYVNEHHHLPGMPSAAEMDANGVSVSKMSNLLLEKVEELTLHMIQLEKENAQLKAKIESLGK